MPGELGGVGSFKLAQAPPQLRELIDAGVDSCSRRAQVAGQVRTDWLVGPAQVNACYLPDLRHGQPQRSQTPDHIDAPERGLIEQAVIAWATARGVDEPHPLVLSNRFDPHPGST